MYINGYRWYIKYIRTSSQQLYKTGLIFYLFKKLRIKKNRHHIALLLKSNGFRLPELEIISVFTDSLDCLK